MDRKPHTDSHTAWCILQIALWISTALIAYCFWAILPLEIEHILVGSCITTALVSILYFLIKHRCWNGWKYVRVHRRVSKSLRRTFIKNKIYIGFNRFLFMTPILQPFNLEFSHDMQTGVLYIRLDPGLFEKLNAINISSALGSYIIDDKNIDEEENWIIYNLIDARIDTRLYFASFKDFCSYYKRVRGMVFNIDERTLIGLTHFLITGITGQGKTYFLKTLLAITWLWSEKNHPIFFFADPKLSGLRKIGRAVGVHVSTEMDEITDMLRTMRDKMFDRYKKRDRLDDSGKDGDAWLDHQRPMIMVLDEAAVYLEYIGTLPASERRSAMKLLSDIARLGREAHCFIWLFMQTAKADLLPTSIRSNLCFRCVLGGDQDTGYQTVLGTKHDIPDNIIVPEGGGYYILEGKTMHPKPLRAPTLYFDLIDELAATGVRFVDGTAAAGFAGGR